MAAATKDAIAIPPLYYRRKTTAAPNPISARNAAHCSLPRLNFLSILASKILH